MSDLAGQKKEILKHLASARQSKRKSFAATWNYLYQTLEPNSEARRFLWKVLQPKELDVIINKLSPKLFYPGIEDRDTVSEAQWVVAEILGPKDRMNLLHQEEQAVKYFTRLSQTEQDFLLNSRSLSVQTRLAQLASPLTRNKIITSYPKRLSLLPNPSDREIITAIMQDPANSLPIILKNFKQPKAGEVTVPPNAWRWLALALLLRGLQPSHYYWHDPNNIELEIKEKALKIWGSYWQRMLNTGSL